MKKIKLIAGNWKMNTTLEAGESLAKTLITIDTENRVVLCPPFTHLSAIKNIINTKNNFSIGAQNVHHLDSGAYTGEVSADMLTNIGVKYVLIGHSERREYANESNQLLAMKVDKALEKGLKPIFCCGESLKTRESGKHVNFVKKQLKESFFHLDKDQMKNFIIAYEPIWAIGTGVTASPEQAQEMHAAIRKLLVTKYGKSIGDSIYILYGGSVNAANVATLFAKPDIDGALVGGASLKVEEFKMIMQA